MGSSLTQGFNYVRIGDNTLTAPSNQIVVSNIPSGYAFLVGYVFVLAGNTQIQATINDDGGAHYDYERLVASGAGVAAATTLNATFWMLMNTAGGFASGCIGLFTISQQPGANLRWITSECGTELVKYQISGRNTSLGAEITKITLQSDAAAFGTGSYLILYGVK